MIDVRQFASQYELVRAQAIGARSGSLAADRTPACSVRGVGLALLLREGLPGWLKAVASLLREVPDRAARSASSVDDCPESHCLAIVATAHAAMPARHHDIARLLANLVLSTRPGARTSPNDAGTRACR